MVRVFVLSDTAVSREKVSGSLQVIPFGRRARHIRRDAAMARGRQRPRDELVLDQVRPRVAPTLEPPLENRAETSAGPGEKIALDRRTRPLPAPSSRIRSNAGAPARRARTFPLTFPVSPPPPLPPATAQDFYEHLSLSEKIVHGRVKLELPHPETSDDEVHAS